MKDRILSGASREGMKKHILEIQYAETTNIIFPVPIIKTLCGVSSAIVGMEPCKIEEVDCKRCLSIYKNKIKPSQGGK